MDDLAKSIGYYVLAGLYLAAMVGSFVAACVMIGWCWRAASWLINGSRVEPFPLSWFALGVLAWTMLYVNRRFEDRQYEDENELT